MIRFSSVAVPFASATIPLTAGAVLSPVQLAELVAVNALPEAVAIVCADRPTLLTATKAFAQALRSAKPVAKAVPVAVAEVAVARFGKAVLAPVAQTEASALAKRWGAVVDKQAATIVALEADVKALQARCDELEQDLLIATSPAPAKAKRVRKAKAAPKAAEAPAVRLPDLEVKATSVDAQGRYVPVASADAEFAGYVPVEEDWENEVY